MTNRLRDDILVSVCFSDATDPEIARTRANSVAQTLGSRYQYWEVLIVTEVDSDADFEATLLSVPNLRHLLVVPGLDNMQRRRVAASEAIGDVVVLTSVHEVEAMNLPAMIDDAQSKGAVILGQRRAAVLAEPLIAALGRASGFQASTRDMQTVAFPRTVLNRLLADPNPVLALRFPPRDKTLRVKRRRPDRQISPRPRSASGPSRASARADLLLRMLTDAGPTLLGTVALMSGAMVLSAVLFALYIIVVNLTLDTVAEGWTTLSLVLSGLLGFLGAALFAICITLRKVAELIQARDVDLLVAEKSSVDLFDSVSHALNVDTDSTKVAEVSSGSHPEERNR